MNLNLKGFKSNCHNKLMGGLIIHKGRHLPERETRILVNLGIEKGYELLSEIPDELADDICKADNYDKYDEYDDTPIFITLSDVESAVRRVAGYACYHLDAEEFVKDVKTELGYEYE